MKTVTIDDVMSWGPCQPDYPRERVEKLFDGRSSLKALEILALRIPAADRLWAVLREDLIPAHGLHELACRFAEQALRRELIAGRKPDPRSWKSIRVKRAWIAGTVTDEQMEAARVAAWAAAWAAAWTAAWAAARAAAWAAAWTAARAAAREAADKRHVATVRRWLRKHGGEA
jgi:hypothetical protein